MPKKLLFIDTNVLLDFYRARDAGLDSLARIEGLTGSLICTYQVEMEFKKNRQGAIIDAFQEFSKFKNVGGAPAFLRESKGVQTLRSSGARMDASIKRLRSQASRALWSPARHDPVYQSLQRLFKGEGSLNLTRDNQEKYRIRKLAAKRFALGYPPRKDRDLAIGDAINWEWIIDCAIRERASVTIVSRDADYGSQFDGSLGINDWLLQEFRSRVSRRQGVRLTDRLTDAFGWMGADVREAEVEEEKTLVAQRTIASGLVERVRVNAEVAESLRERLQAQQAAIESLFKRIQSKGTGPKSAGE